jgi:peptidoglycan-associated lipoprotein
MKPRPSLLVVAGSLLLVAGAFGACAKRPALTAASAPPPTARQVAAAAVQSAPSASPPAATPTTAPAAAPAPQEFAANPALTPIHFDFDKSDIRPGDAQILDKNADWLKAHPNHLVLIEGHCDERGTNQYNLALGDRRARGALQYLLSKGVAAARIITISYGEDRPLCSEHSEACWAQNRRAVFLTKER